MVKHCYIYNINDYTQFYDTAHIIFFEIINNEIHYLYGLYGYNKDDKTIKEINYKEIIKGQKYKLEFKTIKISDFNEKKYLNKYYIKVYGQEIFEKYYNYSDFLTYLYNSNKITINENNKQATYKETITIYNGIGLDRLKENENILNKSSYKFDKEIIYANLNYIFDKCFDRFFKDNRFWEYIKIKFNNKLTYKNLNKIPYWPAHFTDDECENSLSQIKNEYDEIDKEKKKSFLEKYKKLIIGTIIGTIIGIIIKSFFDNINEIWDLINNLI